MRDGRFKTYGGDCIAILSHTFRKQENMYRFWTKYVFHNNVLSILNILTTLVEGGFEGQPFEIKYEDKRFMPSYHECIF